MNKRIIYCSLDVKNFSCTCSSCEETCCGRWNIEMDKKSYKRLKKIKDTVFQSKFDKSFIKYPFLKRNSMVYGRFALNENKECPFLSEKKLCGMQLNHGVEVLSLLCYSFPKITNRIDGRLERSLTPACSEAARLVLLNQNPAQFIEYEEDNGIQLCINRTLNSKTFGIFSKQKKHFHEIRSFTLKILQDKNSHIWERLALLANSYNALRDYLKKEKSPEINNFIEEYLQSYSLDKPEENNEDSLKYQLKAIGSIKNLFMSIKHYTQNLEQYKDCYEEACKGFGFSLDSEQQEIISDEEFYNKYAQLYNEYFYPFMLENEYIFENYVLNTVFRELIPFQIYVDMVDAYTVFVASYTLIIFHLVGMAANNKGLTKEMVVKLVYSFSKVFSHSDNLNKGIFIDLKLKRMLTLPYITAMLKVSGEMA